VWLVAEKMALASYQLLLLLAQYKRARTIAYHKAIVCTSSILLALGVIAIYFLSP
jgi:formate hydrogenlyase subunit 3/multisubunit Na+/H+ antiporter MnhD subunit